MVDVVVGIDDFVVGLDAGLVDGIAVRCVPVSGGDFESGAAGEVEHALDDAFAKGGLANQLGFTVIFESASNDF